MKKAIYLMCALVLLFISSSFVSAWGPVTHYYLGQRLFAESNAPIIQSCQPYQREFIAGMEIPDITVIYYYSKGGQQYKLTHNWNFQEAVLAEATNIGEQCFAYGIATHLIQDGIAHNDFVPMRIREYKLPNWLIHPLSEQAIDTVIANRNPILAKNSTYMLDVLFDGKHEHYFQILQGALGQNSPLNARAEAARLKVAIGNSQFYDKAYTVKGSKVFGAYHIFASFLQKVGPLIGMNDISTANYFLDKVYQDSDYTFKHWGVRYAREPHGFTALGKADKSVMATSILFSIVMILVMLLIGFIVFRYLRNWPLLLRFPIAISLVIVFIFAIILLFLSTLS